MSQMQAVGEVINTSTKKGVSKAGNPFTIHYIEVEGFAEPINVGFRNPYRVGEEVTLDVVYSYGEYKVGKESAKAAPANKTAKQNAAPVRSAGRDSAPFPVPAGHPENRIMRQNALSHAAAIVAARTNIGFYNEVNADDIGVLQAEDILEIANILVDWSTGRREERAVMELNEQNKVA